MHTSSNTMTTLIFTLKIHVLIPHYPTFQPSHPFQQFRHNYPTINPLLIRHLFDPHSFNNFITNLHQPTLQYILMYFQGTFYASPYQCRKSSLELLETSTASSGGGCYSKYKTELCKFWRDYVCCPFGFDCHFAHGPHQLRDKNMSDKYKTSPCKNFHINGFCCYGERCSFSHLIQKEQKSKVFYQSTAIRYGELLDEIDSLEDLNSLSTRLERARPPIFKSLTSAHP